MIVTFAYPSTARFGGGIAALFEYANGLARRGHVVHLAHGPAIRDRIGHVDEIDWFTFEPSIVHHIVDALDDASLPEADVVFVDGVSARHGQPAVLIQGHRMLSASIERHAFRLRCPKICVARWLVDIGVAWGAPREQMLHVPPGIDHHVFRLRRPIPDRPVDVAMLFGDHPTKGASDGLTALRAVHDRWPNLTVTVFARTPPAVELPDWVAVRAGADRHELAKEVFSQARIYVQPSWQEGFGLPAIEAMASGCALVTTDNGGSSDYALPGETAVVVPPRDPDALATALDNLLRDDDRRVRLAQAGERFVRRFDWDVAAEQLERHLEGYLADPAALQRPPREAPMFLEATP